MRAESSGAHANVFFIFSICACAFLAKIQVRKHTSSCLPIFSADIGRKGRKEVGETGEKKERKRIKKANMPSLFVAVQP